MQAIFRTATVSEVTDQTLDVENSEDIKLKQDIEDVVNLYFNEAK